MKTHRIIGLLWAGLCACFCFNVSRGLLALWQITPVSWQVAGVWAAEILLYSAAMVADILLLRLVVARSGNLR